MAPVISSARPDGNSILSVTPANVFALLFELLLVVLIVLSIVAIVRRYCRGGGSLGRSQPPTTVVLKVEGRGNASTKASRRFALLSALSSALARSKSGGGSLGDTASLLDNDAESLPPRRSNELRTSADSSDFKRSNRIGSYDTVEVKVSLRSSIFRALSQSPPQPALIERTQFRVDARHSTEVVKVSATFARPDGRAVADVPRSQHASDCPPGDMHAWLAPHQEVVHDYCSKWTVPSPEAHLCVLEEIQPSTAADVPRIAVTSSTDAFTEPESPGPELDSPTSTYSQPDSPIVMTPPLGFDTGVSLWAPVNDLHHGKETRNASGDSGDVFESEPGATSNPKAKAHPKAFVGGAEGFGLGVGSIHVKSLGPSASLVLHTILEEQEEEEAEHAPWRIITASRKLDPTPLQEFALRGPAIVIPRTSGNCTNAAYASLEDGDDWAAAYRISGRLMDAFAPSACSLDDDDKSGGDDSDEPPVYMSLHKVGAERRVRCRSAYKLVRFSFTAIVEWCDAASASGVGSSESSDSEDMDKGGDFESGSSFLSSTGSSSTEDGVLDLECLPKLKDEEPSASPALDRLLHVYCH
ncbi:hypothetical protein BV20DRAFT_735963 [Pilatotrama ljubarskyi]|nr:hypothetical protein BV20DRAFT_735963 [Pilatotrama ljubarskyi]